MAGSLTEVVAVRTVDPVRRAARRRLILEAAARCFGRTGFAGTTVADICRLAGISSGSLFHYFPTKRAVFTAIFETDAEEIAARLAGTGPDPWATVLAEVDRQVAELADPDAAGLAAEVVAQAARDPEIAAVVGARDRVLRDGLAALIARAAAEGRVGDDVPPRTAADWVCGLLAAVAARSGVDPEFRPRDQLPVLRLILTRFLRADAP